MNTFYCVNVEFYDNGKVLACIDSRLSDGKPNSQFRRVNGMSAFKLWFAVDSYAKKLLSSINSGTIGLEKMLSIWADWNDSEKEAAA